MASFTQAELDYLGGDRRLGRLATADAAGMPHVVPIGWWRVDTDEGTVELSGRDLAASKKYRNVQANGKAAFVVDDMASIDPWRPRAVMIQGRAEVVEAGDGDEDTVPAIRIHPDAIVSWGLEDAG